MTEKPKPASTENPVTTEQAEKPMRFGVEQFANSRKHRNLCKLWQFRRKPETPDE